MQRERKMHPAKTRIDQQIERNEHIDDMLDEQIRQMRLLLAGIISLLISREIFPTLPLARKQRIRIKRAS